MHSRTCDNLGSDDESGLQPFTPASPDRDVPTVNVDTVYEYFRGAFNGFAASAELTVDQPLAAALGNAELVGQTVFLDRVRRSVRDQAGTVLTTLPEYLFMMEEGGAH